MANILSEDPPEWHRHYNAALARGLTSAHAAEQADELTFGDCRDLSDEEFDFFDDDA